jgi:hypothetical protein
MTNVEWRNAFSGSGSGLRKRIRKEGIHFFFFFFFFAEVVLDLFRRTTQPSLFSSLICVVFFTSWRGFFCYAPHP